MGDSSGWVGSATLNTAQQVGASDTVQFLSETTPALQRRCFKPAGFDRDRRPIRT
jgi:hypothetical protein